MTKGFVWNVLANNFDLNYDYHILAKIKYDTWVWRIFAGWVKTWEKE